MTRTAASHHPHPHPHVRRHAAAALTMLLALGALTACGSGAEDDAGSSGDLAGIERDDTTGSPGGGWVGGSPEFDGSDGSESRVGADEDGAAMASSAKEAAPPSTLASAPGGADAVVGAQAEPLRAGSVDDNVDYVGFLAYLDRMRAAGLVARPWDPAGRILVQVSGPDGRGTPARAVTVRAEGGQDPVATVRTTADGTIRFLPATYGPVAARYSFELDGRQVSGAPGETLQLAVDAAGAGDEAPAVDVLFLLDATGSMGDEIGRLTDNIATIAGQVDALAPDADVRFGMTLYRDDVDQFTTATYDLTGDIDAFGRALDEVVADGGGDYPEALDEGLAEALAVPSWRPAGEALQLIFVVADAPPQLGRQVDTPYTESLQEAMARGIKVFPVASSGTDDVAELVFRELAQATGGRFVFLAYGAAGAALGTGTDIATTDYEELSLDQLVVRLIAEELGDWTGTDVVVPLPGPTSTTRPAGQ